MHIDFNIPPYVGTEEGYISEAIHSHVICGDGAFTKKCSSWLEEKTGAARVLLTTSGTHALEMAALLSGVKPGDEVIMSSFTFASTADAFVLRGAKIIFVDINPQTMNIDEKLIESLVTPKTKAVVPMHYAGVACEMDSIIDIAKRHELVVVEDAAQAIMSTYKGRKLGTIGDFGCYSFHETKNFSMGEGGAISIRNAANVSQAEIIREKGTDRSRFFRGEVDKYSWQDAGSSYLPSELNAAYLWAQLEKADEIMKSRMDAWNMYYEMLKPLQEKGIIELPFIPEYCTHNAHMFYIKTGGLNERTKLIDFLDENGINSVFHYIPLHSSAAGKRYGEFRGEDKVTTKESERLLRLPMFYGISSEQVEYICEKLKEFYE